MKTITTIKENLKHGINNFFSIKPINIIVIVTLILIILLSYVSSSRIDLFGVIEASTTTPITTPPSLAIREVVNPNLLQSFLAQLNGQTYNVNKFQKILNQRQNVINNIQSQQTQLKDTTFKNAIGVLNIN